MMRFRVRVRMTKRGGGAAAESSCGAEGPDPAHDHGYRELKTGEVCWAARGGVRMARTRMRLGTAME